MVAPAQIGPVQLPPQIVKNIASQQAEAQFQERRGESDVRRQELIEQARQAREADLARGRERAQELFGEGVFGTREQAARQADIEDIVSRRREALAGFSGEELGARRAEALQDIARRQQTQARQLRGIQAQAGVRGGLAGAQQAALLQQAQQAQAGAERDIFLQDVAQRRQALGEFETTVGAEQERAQQERLAQLSTEFGFAGLGAAERGAAAQQVIAEEQARQAAVQQAKEDAEKK